MKPFRFVHALEDGLFVSRSIDLDGGPLRGGTAIDFHCPDDEPVPARVAFAGRERAAACVRFARHAAGPHFAFALPNWCRNRVAHELARDPDPVAWEFVFLGVGEDLGYADAVVVLERVG